MARYIIFAVFIVLALIAPQAANASRYRHKSRYPRRPSNNVGRFVERYYRALGSCNIRKVKKFYSPSLETFRAIGLSGDRAGLLEGYKRFCKAFPGTKFTIVEIDQVAPYVVFVRIKASNPIFRNGPVRFSEAIMLEKRRRHGLSIRHDVITASGDTFAAAVASQK